MVFLIVIRRELSKHRLQDGAYLYIYIYSAFSVPKFCPMKKIILFLAALLFVFGSCKKKANTYTVPANTPSPGSYAYWLGEISGLFNISLLKNSDTTITMPIQVYVQIYAYATPEVTVSFGTLPADVVRLAPASYSTWTSFANNVVTDSISIHIHAVDSGSFPVTVFANCNGGGAAERSDSFKIIVH